MAFFSRIGLMTRAYDNGLVYPYSESAADVAELLEKRARELGITIITDAEVLDLKVREENQQIGGRFAATYASHDRGGKPVRRTIFADNVVLAAGGKAGPSYGTTGDGYRFARDLGHSIVTPVPVLTGVECSEWKNGSRPCGITLAGTRTRGKVSLFKGAGKSDHAEEHIFSEEGEIQFTKYGLSGICIFNMTRHMRYDRSKGESLADFVVRADLYPDGDIREFLRERSKNAFPGELAIDALRTVLKSNIAEYVIGSRGKGLRDKALSKLNEEDINHIAKAVHELEFHPEGIRGWKEAQATSGGVSVSEISGETCESQIVDGLYITGELADRDYPCGGYNLSNAWITGMKAARAIAKAIK